MMEEIEPIVRRMLSKRLTSAVGTFHFFRGRESADPIAVWLTFEETQYRFAGAPNGWHLVVDDVAPKEVDMGESGAIRIRDLSARPIYAAVMGQLVRDCWLVESTLPNGIIGVRFGFDASTMRILNWGDEMYVAHDFPRDADPREIVERLI